MPPLGCSDILRVNPEEPGGDDEDGGENGRGTLEGDLGPPEGPGDIGRERGAGEDGPALSSVASPCGTILRLTLGWGERG